MLRSIRCGGEERLCSLLWPRMLRSIRRGGEERLCSLLWAVNASLYSPRDSEQRICSLFRAVLALFMALATGLGHCPVLTTDVSIREVSVVACCPLALSPLFSLIILIFILYCKSINSASGCNHLIMVQIQQNMFFEEISITICFPLHGL